MGAFHQVNQFGKLSVISIKKYPCSTSAGELTATACGHTPALTWTPHMIKLGVQLDTVGKSVSELRSILTAARLSLAATTSRRGTCVTLKSFTVGFLN